MTFTKPTLWILALGSAGVLLNTGLITGQTQALDFESSTLNLATIVNILTLFFVVSLLIERGCEMITNLLTNLRLLPRKEDASTDNARAEAERQRSIAALLICLVLSGFFMGVGLFLMEMVLDEMFDPDPTVTANFRFADVVLTMLILAGGSDGVHQMIQKLLAQAPTGQTNPGD